MITIIILSLIFTILDQIVKILVIKNLTPGINIPLIKNFLSIFPASNTGAAFSLLTGKSILLIIIAIIIITYLIIYLSKNNPKTKSEIIAYSFIIGGSLGNLIDRIIRGYVIDYISIKINTYQFPIFNIADTLIVAGVLLLIITTKGGKK